MITFKTGYSKKERQELIGIMSELTDLFGDFYITKNNLRMFIKDNPNLLFDCLKNGDKIAYDERGIAIVLGFSDNMPRKYLKILTKDSKALEDLLQIVCWNVTYDLYIKVKKNNPIKDILIQYNFEFLGGRGKEILLVRKYKGVK